MPANARTHVYACICKMASYPEQDVPKQDGSGQDGPGKLTPHWKCILMKCLGHNDNFALINEIFGSE
jgi:hypothetical protein